MIWLVRLRPRNRGRGGALFLIAKSERFVLGWVLTFLFLTVVAAYLSFFGLSGMAATLVKIVFVVFAVLFAATSLIGLLGTEPPA